jgi:hypothetical protein
MYIPIPFATLLLLATTVSSQAIIQLLAQLPPCAIDCLTSGLQDYGCAIRDVVCSCGYKAEITAAVTPCVDRTCSESDGDCRFFLFHCGVCSWSRCIGSGGEEEKESGAEGSGVKWIY